MYKNILIVKLSAIGDVIHALPVASAIKAHYPQARVSWIVEKPAYDILENNPNIDEIIVFDKAKFKSFGGFFANIGQLSKILKSHQYDLALDLQGLFKSAAIAWLSGAKTRLVYCNAREMSHLISDRVCGNHSEGHVVEKYLDVARYLGCTVDGGEFAISFTQDDADKSIRIACHAGLDLNHKFIVLAPGTNWSTKCWPTDHYAQLVDLLYGQNFIPVIVGGRHDQRLYEQIAAKTQVPPINLTGCTSLKQLAYITKQASAFVGGDTGPMHLAAAVNTRVVALFGPTDPKRNGPYGGHHIILTSPAQCTGCWKRNCEKDCMVMINPLQVFEALQRILPCEVKGG